MGYAIIFGVGLLIFLYGMFKDNPLIFFGILIMAGVAEEAKGPQDTYICEGMEGIQIAHNVAKRRWKINKVGSTDGSWFYFDALQNKDKYLHSTDFHKQCKRVAPPYSP